MIKLNTKRNIRTVYYMYLIFFLVTSFIFLSDAIMPYVAIGKFSYLSVIIKNQGLVIISLILSFILTFYNYKFFGMNSEESIFIGFLIIFGTLLLNILTLLFGSNINGANRWFSLFGFLIQPSEFSKLALIYIAVFYYKFYQLYKNTKLIKFKKMYYICFFTALFMIALVLLGKALTTTIILFLLFNLLILFTNVLDKQIFFTEFFLSLLGIIFYASINFNKYIKPRLSHLFSESTLQSHVVLARNSYTLGGLYGSGFFKGIMKYFYLPESYNDYIMSIIGEQTGFIGVLIIFIILLSFSFFLFNIASKSNIIAYKMVMIGFGLIILIQTTLHLFITTGTISTGVILPFYSNGGSFSILLAGLILITSEGINNLSLEDK